MNHSATCSLRQSPCFIKIFEPAKANESPPCITSHGMSIRLSTSWNANGILYDLSYITVCTAAIVWMVDPPTLSTCTLHWESNITVLSKLWGFRRLMPLPVYTRSSNKFPFLISVWILTHSLAVPLLLPMVFTSPMLRLTLSVGLSSTPFPASWVFLSVCLFLTVSVHVAHFFAILTPNTGV